MIKHLDELVRQAKLAQAKAYAPYSKFKVGAALMLSDHNYIQGVNCENASYGLTCCAERVAIYNAITQGYSKKDILALAIVSDSTGDTSPCGACRQVMFELLDPKTPVYCVNAKNEVKEYQVEDFLPQPFKAEGLK